MTIEEKLNILKSLSLDPSWDDMIKPILEDMVLEIRDIANVEDIKEITGYNVNLAAMYIGKLIASKKLKDFIKAVEIQKEKPTAIDDIRNSME